MEAYAALQSEEILGYNVQVFISTDDETLPSSVNGVPMIKQEDTNWQTIDRKNVQFIVAIEFESVSVIPALRGVCSSTAPTCRLSSAMKK